MSSKEIVGLLRKNIWQAIKDYGIYTSQTEVLEDVSDDFVNRLAKDAVEAKQDLRTLFRKSPVWNEELQALVINGTRTHDPDYSRIKALAGEIFCEYCRTCEPEMQGIIRRAISFFCRPNASEERREKYIEAIQKIAPKAYKPNRKLSRIFKNICDVLGVTDETQGSDFQRLYAQLANELSAKKINFKMYVSINPAHFITMSNPKNDDRGQMLTSCHSFNSTEYEYNCGCTGYARDSVTMIAFTVDDPDDPETLNNRKTSRQLFMYKVGNGLLLQSRMYNTNGGTYGAQKESILYRDLIQREISELEGVPNLWKTYTYRKDKPDNICITRAISFGGYTDWAYEEFDAKVSIRTDHKDDYKNFEVGTYGLCISCGEEIGKGLYCDDCGNENHIRCECCEHHYYREDMYQVHDGADIIWVCESCLDNYYTRCEHCEEYHSNDQMVLTANRNWVCPNCLDDYYEYCDVCEEYHHQNEMNTAFNSDDDECRICDDCLESGEYYYCDKCGYAVHSDVVVTVHDRNNDSIYLCSACWASSTDYSACESCGEIHHVSNLIYGYCPDCVSEDTDVTQ